MLTQACNKIEAHMLGGSSSTNKINHKTATLGSPRHSPPKRSRPLEISDSEEGPSSASPPSNKQPRLHSTSPKQDFAKVSQPLASNEVKRSTPEQRPRPTSVSSLSSLSPTARASSQSLYGAPPIHPGLAGHFHPMLPPGYPGLPPHLAGLSTPHPPASNCTNPMCTDMTCQTGAARASFLMGVPPHPSLNLLNLMHPPNPAAPAQPPPTTSPYVCNWMSGADFCGRRFSTSEDLMSHLRTHTASAASTSAPAPASTTHPAVTAALAQALMSTAPMVTSTTTTSALAALQAQAVKLATAPSRSPVATPTAPATTTTTTSATAAWAAAAAAANSADLANAAAARYHAALSTARPAFPPSFGIPPGALHPHLASLYGLGNPYGSLQQQQLQMLYQMP
jgi:hypothetical protein